MFRQWGKLGCVCAALVLVLALAGSASARDLPSSIAAAESRAEAASGEIAELKADLGPVTSHYAKSSRRARPARVRVAAAKHRVTTIEARDHTNRARALAAAHNIKADNQKSKEKHDEKVAGGAGIGLGFLVIALVVLAWGWFRATAAVAALTRITLAQAVGLCVGGGFLTILIGAVMEDGGGVLRVIGVALVVLGLTLPIALLTARHSAEVQRGRSKPLLRRERFPVRLTQALAIVLGAFCLIGFGSAILAPGAKSKEVPATLTARANAGDDQDQALATAQAKASKAASVAKPLLAAQGRAQNELRKARRALGHAESRLAAAKNHAKQFSHQLVALEVHEQREGEREERRALRQQEKEEREYQAQVQREEREYERALEREEHEAALAVEKAEEAEACDPNYEGACLHEGIGDYDCAGGSGDGPNYVSGPIYVVGYDEFGLDSDGDGVACEDG
jgi:hypothetical protein